MHSRVNPRSLEPAVSGSAGDAEAVLHVALEAPMRRPVQLRVPNLEQCFRSTQKGAEVLLHHGLKLGESMRLHHGKVEQARTDFLHDRTMRNGSGGTCRTC